VKRNPPCRPRRHREAPLIFQPSPPLPWVRGRRSRRPPSRVIPGTPSAPARTTGSSAQEGGAVGDDGEWRTALTPGRRRMGNPQAEQPSPTRGNDDTALLRGSGMSPCSSGSSQPRAAVGRRVGQKECRRRLAPGMPLPPALRGRTAPGKRCVGLGASLGRRAAVGGCGAVLYGLLTGRVA